MVNVFRLRGFLRIVLLRTQKNNNNNNNIGNNSDDPIFYQKIIIYANFPNLEAQHERREDKN